MGALTVTVSQLNRYLKALLDEDTKLSGIFVRGEISNFTRHYKSGHLYFTVRDKDSAIRAVMFRTHAEDLRFEPENGMAVLVQANVTVYERDGVYQLYVTDMQPDGAGALAVAFEQVKNRLAARGLFDEAHKKPLPEYPRRIGVVTSETGAALQDIINVLTRRYPLAGLLLCPAVVQGREAPMSLIRALQALDANGGCDVIILARGGGSAEDLAAFNDEALASAVFAAETPVVSAVGHETDFTICDFVADLRAPTPSAAAELCTPSAEQLARRLASTRMVLRAGARQKLLRETQRLARSSVLLRAGARQGLRRRDERLERVKQAPALRSPRAWLMKNHERLDFLSGSLYNKKSAYIHWCGERLARRAALLDTLSPLRVLQRGYCVATREGDAVTSVGRVAPGEALEVRFRDGVAGTVVRTIRKEDINE